VQIQFGQESGDFLRAALERRQQLTLEPLAQPRAPTAGAA
jgi:hypothetical protein